MDLDFGRMWGFIEDSIPDMVMTNPYFNRRKMILLSGNALLTEGVLSEYGGEVRRWNTAFSLRIMKP